MFFFRDIKATFLSLHWSILLLVLLVVFSTGCASVMSKDALKDINPDVTIAAVQAAPAKYKDAKVVWGGVIVAVDNLADRTHIEVLQTSLDRTHKPERILPSPGGRFIVEVTGYVDPFVYKTERRVTVAGTIKGIKKKKIGKMDYPYPVLTPVEMKLFGAFSYTDDPESPAHNWFYPPYDPYWPFYRPYYPYYPYR